ncbi:hypothetical protein ACFSHT_28645 [Paraburkholderia silviterrae]|uniref:Uncharacterized protein n=1 Tax=Paraburkholderia silviterrae TaxID=2528715 RepID=A0A4R5M5P2_9BURK|nr:hypothetical protein [Paraburkholderia silviterrae]TDG21201.1 hypothetical protein EYW47_22820 [Paraburkholderia silviterrae]
MRNQFRHPLAKQVGVGLMQLGVLIAWGCGGMQWFLESYVPWAAQRVQRLSLLAVVPAALALALAGAAVVLVTLQFPPIAVALAEGAAQRTWRGRGDA